VSVTAPILPGMPPAPDIVTPRLLLREPTDADRAVWIRLHRDPRTYAHAPHAMAPTDEAAGEQFDKVVRHWGEHGFGYHLVEQDGSVVGCGGLKVNPATEDHGRELNLYYRLAFEAHGQGLAREAARAWVAWGIEWLPAQPIVAAVSVGEPAVDRHGALQRPRGVGAAPPARGSAGVRSGRDPHGAIGRGGARRGVRRPDP
jgi:Acetyltransferases, including N-acetylases of ribosomal proteins